MKHFLILILLLNIIFLYNINAFSEYTGSSFQMVRDVMFEHPYDKLPKNEITLKSFGWSVSDDNKLKKAVNRTLNEHYDFYPHFDKLLHANGICFSGTWEIDSNSPDKYSGYFAPGSRALLLARASVTLSETTRGNKRGFALAGKLFPTMDRTEITKTGNFFTIENLLGIKKDFFTDAILTNEPNIGFTLSPSLLVIGSRIIREFGLADSNPGFRDLYQISELGLPENKPAKTPHWIKITRTSGMKQVTADDFREELTLAEGQTLTFDISVADQVGDISIDKAQWEKIGKIVLVESVISEGCDHRIHFAHPKNKR